MRSFSKNKNDINPRFALFDNYQEMITKYPNHSTIDQSQIFAIIKNNGMWLYKKTNNEYNWVQFIAAGDQVLIGSVEMFYSEINDSNWLLCDGSTYDTTEYSELYSLLGTNTLPNLVNKTITGSGTGISVGTVISPTIAEHTHIVNDSGHTHTYTQTNHSHNINRHNDGSGGSASQTIRNWRGSSDVTFGNSLNEYGDTNQVTPWNIVTEQSGLSISDTQEDFKPNSFGIFYYMRAK